MKSKKWIWLLLILLGLLFAVVGPIVINECYRSGTGYLTFWGPADVLSYYATILGAAIAVASLTITILFTKQQLLRESYIKNETKKWEKINDIITQALNDLNPYTPLQESMDTGLNAPCDAMIIFRKYQMKCITFLDPMTAYISTEDYEQVKPLIDKMYAVAKIFQELSEREIQLYTKLHSFNNKDEAADILSSAFFHPNAFDSDFLTTKKQIIQNSKGLTLSEIQEKICEANSAIIKAYAKDYRPLLQIKRDIFNIITSQIQTNADYFIH